MPRIEIYDTTLRDGAQGEGISFSLPDKLALTERLDELGFDYVEGGYPASNEKDFQYFQRMRHLGLKRTKVCAFGMTRRKGAKAETDAGLKALLDSGAAVITLVGKTSAFQATEVLRTTRDENLAMIRDSVAYLRPRRPRGDVRRRAFLRRLEAEPRLRARAVRAAAEAGAAMVVLCDTNGGSMPDEVAEITAAAIAGLPVPVGIHCHNDCDLAVANSLAAVEAGAVQVQGTHQRLRRALRQRRSDLGDRQPGREETGLRSCCCPTGSTRLTELSRYVYEMVNMNFRANQPFVGKSAFAHKGGMHVSGIARTTASYEHIDPQQVGNERRVLVSELSGRSNIAAVTTSAATLSPDAKQTEQILAKVVSMENAGYQFEAAEASFNLLVQRCMNKFRPHFEPLHYDVNVDNKVGRGPGRGHREAARGRGSSFRGGRGRWSDQRPQRGRAEGPERPVSRP